MPDAPKGGKVSLAAAKAKWPTGGRTKSHTADRVAAKKANPAKPT